MTVERLLSPADLLAVTEAARRVEAASAAEIVPYLVRESDGYESPLWKGATLGAVFAASIAGATLLARETWGGATFAWTALPALTGALLGAFLGSSVPAIRRSLAGRGAIERRVRRRAQAAFLEEEIWRTRERTGVLIFVSLFERRVEILADQGLNAKVTQAEWDGIARQLAAQLRADQARDGLLQAIEGCGTLLQKHGFTRPADDRNELRDGVRTGDR